MKAMNITILMTAMLTIFGGCGDDDKSDDVATPEKRVNITISPENAQIDFEGGVVELTVNADGDWSVSTQSDFCTVNRKGGIKGETKIKATIAKNTSADTRTAVLNFLGGKTSLQYSITQDYDRASFDNNEITAPDGYKMVWHDEFDDNVLSNDWTYEVQNSGWVNNELQNYRKSEIDGKKTVETIDGILNINCFKGSDDKVYSGRIKAKESQGWQYGYIEARIKLPKGKGTWPAFWMMPCKVDWEKEGWPKCGEIDIMEEVGANPNYVSSSLHAEGHVHTLGNQITHEMLCKGAEDDFHVYSIEWSKEEIKTYVDGKLQLSYSSDGTVKNYPYDKPYYIILNLAWGGDWGGYKGIDESALPTTMQVDYVRVFQKK
ncbi:MAG: family 16 glycosylhydrolase [Bacteroidales bacterium]|nr:family 16 glycosylhydrolase [Bacteroidales bacterium]